MFASPGEMRVEARRNGVRVAHALATWNENVEDILKTSMRHSAPLPADRRPVEIPADLVPPAESVSVCDRVDEEELHSFEELRAPSQPKTPPPSSSRLNRPRSTASRDSSEARDVSEASSSNSPRESFANPRHTIVKFQLFS
jgi:hypothetical protein